MAAPSSTFPIHVDVVTGRCHTIDALWADAGCSDPYHRRAWYTDDQHRESSIRTVVARSPCGAPLLSLPTAPLGHALFGVRGVPGSYWPFRSISVAPHGSSDDLRAVFAQEKVVAALKGRWRLGPVYADDVGAIRLVEGARLAGWTVLRRSLGRSFRLDLSEAVTGVWPSRSSRKRLRAYERQLAAAVGPVTIETYSGCRWSPRIIELMHQIEADSWVGLDTDQSGAKFGTAANRRRWLRMIADPVIADTLSATILSAGGRAIAYSFDLRAGNRQYAIASNYRERFAEYRPGRIVTTHQLLAAATNGVTDVDLGLGDSGYKQQMGAVPGPELVDYLFVRNGVAAAIAARHWCGERESLGALRPTLPWIAATIATTGAVALMAD